MFGKRDKGKLNADPVPAQDVEVHGRPVGRNRAKSEKEWMEMAHEIVVQPTGSPPPRGQGWRR